MKTPDWLGDWWAERIASDKAERESLLAADPGYPSTYGTCLGEPTIAPWSAVVGARNKLPIVISLPKLKASVMAALERAK